MPLLRDGTPLSTIDLLTGIHGGQWRRVADEGAHRLAIQLAVDQMGADGLTDPTSAWTTRYRVTDSDAVLIRPDRFIAWRSTGHNDPQSWERALRRVLDR